MFKGSVVIKRRLLINAIENQRFIFKSRVSKESKSFAWGRQTSFEDILEGTISETNWNEFMHDPSIASWRFWIAEGLNFVLGEKEN